MRKPFKHVKFTYRIDPKLKKALEVEAVKNGRLLSQEITHRLNASLKEGKNLNER